MKKTEGSWQDEVLSLCVNLQITKQMKAVRNQTEKSYSESKSIIPEGLPVKTRMRLNRCEFGKNWLKKFVYLPSWPRKISN